jgi:hypothetical protein
MSQQPILAIVYNAAEHRVSVDRRNRSIRHYEQPTTASANRLAHAALDLDIEGIMRCIPTTYGWYLAK